MSRRRRGVIKLSSVFSVNTVPKPLSYSVVQIIEMYLHGDFEGGRMRWAFHAHNTLVKAWNQKKRRRTF